MFCKWTFLVFGDHIIISQNFKQMAINLHFVILLQNILCTKLHLQLWICMIIIYIYIYKQNKQVSMEVFQTFGIPKVIIKCNTHMKYPRPLQDYCGKELSYIVGQSDQKDNCQLLIHILVLT
jgi:hypothetical protein